METPGPSREDVAPVIQYTGEGEDTDADVYRDYRRAVWNDDAVHLRDGDGDMIAEFEHSSDSADGRASTDRLAGCQWNPFMTTYTVERPEGSERGIRVACTEHDEFEEFEPGYRKVAFCCERCGYEVAIELRDLLEWRDLGERC